MFEKQIQAGVAYLNKHYPNWLTTIDTERLNMRDQFNCIIGQLANGYYSIFSDVSRYEDSTPVLLGFTCTEQQSEATYSLRHDEPSGYCFDILTREWKTTIAALRS